MMREGLRLAYLDPMAVVALVAELLTPRRAS